MRKIRPLLTVAAAGVISIGLLGSPASAAYGDNFVYAEAWAAHTVDQRSSVMVVANATDTVDNGNLAKASSHDCTGCRSVAVAFQVVLVPGAPHTVAPGNAALSFNVNCNGCTAVAVAKQQLIYTDGATGIDREAQRRVDRIAAQVRAIAVSGASPASIDAQLQPLWVQLVSVIHDGLQESRDGAENERTEA